MHRRWFNPSLVPPVDGTVYWLRLINWQYFPYKVVWDALDNGFKSPTLNRFISIEETLMISEV